MIIIKKKTFHSRIDNNNNNFNLNSFYSFNKDGFYICSACGYDKEKKVTKIEDIAARIKTNNNPHGVALIIPMAEVFSSIDWA